MSAQKRTAKKASKKVAKEAARKAVKNTAAKKTTKKKKVAKKKAAEKSAKKGAKGSLKRLITRPVRKKAKKVEPRKSILAMNPAEARAFLLKEESYCNFDLPPYFTFTALLSKVAKQLKGKDLKRIGPDKDAHWEVIDE